MNGKPVRVGVFDSGIGGLSVLKECVSCLPQAQYFYLGDNLRAPYGSRATAEIVQFVEEAMDVFRAMAVDAVVLACNTATAVCAERLRHECSFPVIGMEPALKPAAAACSNVLVLATERTAESERVRRLAARFPACRFTLHGASDLAGLIERRLLFGEEFCLARELPMGRFDGVVLGCTHYIFYKSQIASFYSLPVFDGNLGTARRLARLMGEQNAQKLGTENHRQPQEKVKQMYGNGMVFSENGVYFLGKSAKMNKRVYETNICFKKI